MKSCGTCTMCCKLMKVDELNKPENLWCENCDIGKGCRVYEARPTSCREFECVWLQSQEQEVRMVPALRPDRSKVVLTTKEKSFYAFVDPARPDAWKQGPMGELIDKLRREFRVIVVCGNSRKLLG